MSPINIVLGLSVAGISFYSGLWFARFVRPLLKGMARIEPMAAWMSQSVIGLCVAILVGATLSVARIRLGLIPDGADPQFPGELLGVSAFVWVGAVLAFQLFMAILANRLMTLDAPDR